MTESILKDICSAFGVFLERSPPHRRENRPSILQITPRESPQSQMVNLGVATRLIAGGGNDSKQKRPPPARTLLPPKPQGDRIQTRWDDSPRSGLSLGPPFINLDKPCKTLPPRGCSNSLLGRAFIKGIHSDAKGQNSGSSPHRREPISKKQRQNKWSTPSSPPAFAGMPEQNRTPLSRGGDLVGRLMSRA